MNQKVIDELLADGRITRVPVNVAGSRTLLSQAARHLESAGAIAATDPSLAYVALYDAARKSVLAHMLAHGYREVVRPGPAAGESSARPLPCAFPIFGDG